MARDSYGRYPSDQEWLTPQEHSALRSEALVMLILLVVGLLCVFCEPILDWLEVMIR